MVLLRGPQTAWPPPRQVNECCYFNEVWNLYALKGEAMLGRLCLAVSTINTQKQSLQSSPQSTGQDLCCGPAVTSTQPTLVLSVCL